MKLTILSPREKLFQDEVKEVVLPGSDGEFSVWDFHQPFLYRLSQGYIKIVARGQKRSGNIKSFEINDGMAKMNKNELTIMIEVPLK
jgi:F-type H+-transporting ATPase subunit epsilon